MKIKNRIGNWVYVENNEDKDYYVNIVPTKNGTYYIGERSGDGEIVPIREDKMKNFTPIYQILIKKYRKK